jgi:hypothetical protein
MTLSLTKMRPRRLLQGLLRHFGYQLIRNTRPPVLQGHSHDSVSAMPSTLRNTLSIDNPRLTDLRERYASTKLPMLTHTWWTNDYVKKSVDLTHFRGDNAYVWQTRHMKGLPEVRYFLYANDVLQRDQLGLFELLSDDGAFGSFTYQFQRFPALSRDLLDSVNELNFLQRHAAISEIVDLQILDIGAGYGRLAHRSIEALPNLQIYYCCDAVPESTFLSEFYLQYRHCEAKAKVIPADQLAMLNGKSPHLAVNVHSFSEMCLTAIEGWLDLIQDLAVPWLFIVPNDSEAFLSMEQDGTRREFSDSISSRGYHLVAKEQVIADPDVRRLVGVQDHLFLFKRDIRA